MSDIRFTGRSFWPGQLLDGQNGPVCPTNVLRLEGERYGINVNTVVPNAATRMSEGAMTPEMFEKLKPDYIPPAVLYLCSEECVDSGM